MITLKYRGSETTMRVHRLIALAFLGEPPAGADSVNHINFDRSDNNVTNLQWCSPAQNTAHSHRAGRIFPRNKVIVENEVYALCEKGWTLSAIGRHFGVTPQAISQFLKREKAKDASDGSSAIIEFNLPSPQDLDP